jgi:hypothetical protein
MTTTTLEAPKMQTLKCRHGEGHEWERPAQRGKPPHFCAEHMPAKPVRVPRAPKDNLLEAKGETETELTEEQIKARQEKERKRQETLRLKREAEERAAAEQRVATIAELQKVIPVTFAQYDEALAKALKSNDKKDWRKAEVLQGAAIGQTQRLRRLEAEAA